MDPDRTTWKRRFNLNFLPRRPKNILPNASCVITVVTQKLVTKGEWGDPCFVRRVSPERAIELDSESPHGRKSNSFHPPLAGARRGNFSHKLTFEQTTVGADWLRVERFRALNVVSIQGLKQSGSAGA